MVDQVITDATDGSGSSVLRVDDVTDVALELAERLSADLIEGEKAFSDAIEQRRAALAERVAAHAALELLARSSPDAEPLVVNDIAGLRTLVGRIEEADRLVEGATEDARRRAGSASGLAVHPSSIRDAAADVLEARATVLEHEMEVRRLEDPATPETPDAPTEPPEHETAAPVTPSRRPGLRLTEPGRLRTAAVVTVAALAVAILVLILTGSPLVLVLPAVGVCWLSVLVVRQRDDSYDEKVASRNLENVARLTDRAYGGAGLAGASSDPLPDPELEEARRALAVARDRLTYAESSWRSLVGPDAEVDDVENVLRARDAQYGITDAVVLQLPSYRAAAAHRRRLRAQWKLAWWVLDRPVPSVDDAEAAIDALAAEGVDEIVVAGSESGLSAEEQARYDDLASGRTEDELRDAASQRFPVVVVSDPDGTIDEARLRDETAQLPDDVRFVVVAPAD